jgi:phospholipid transport system substrate-binding protein
MRIFLAACAVLVVSGAQAQLLVPPSPRPEAVMQAMTGEVAGVLRADRAAGRPTDLGELVERSIVPVFDFSRMTRIAVGRSWPLASPEQQAALVEQFKTLLVRTYSQALSDYRDQEIDYRRVRTAPGDTEAVVRSVVRRPGVEAMTIDYDMAEGMWGWKVYDVKVGGASLVLGYESSFADIVRVDGIDGLIKSLAERNRENAKGAAAGALAPRLLIYSKGARPVAN